MSETRNEKDMKSDNDPEPTQQCTLVEEVKEKPGTTTTNNNTTDTSTSNEAKWVKTQMYAKMGTQYQPYRDISNEFKSLKDWKPSQFSSTVWKKNAEKNRYADQMCMDQTRVVLKNREGACDYINASWMEMPDGRKWISTQGPLKTTIEDFWHLIYSENIKVICMLCCFQEDGVEKCSEYFNIEGKKSETFGIYKVRIKTKTTEPFSSIRQTVLEVEKKNSKSPPVVVTHLWNYGWVDHFCPTDTTPTVWMLKTAMSMTGKTPIVVHCSAGIGRTATFVGIDFACQKIKQDPEIKMCDVLFNLRRMRLRSIQSQLQFAFLHQCIVEWFAQANLIARDEQFEKLRNCFESVVKKMIKTQGEAKKQYYAAKVTREEKEKSKAQPSRKK
ncbi:unnamed protein product [Caenorhabditis angaria]|uniref:Protein-tyrosine phosphatase n=1 Tax=Caenorhabditis angaria TaxID=860376 RepID=A0A9P1IMY2_9PELO|nr:unnamed protein product [Caenorhabditis angaria]